jgi:hypothetical protein
MRGLTLAQNASTTCTSSHLVNQGDVNSGIATFFVRASLATLTLDELTLDELTEDDPIEQTAAATLSATTTSTGPYVLGSTIGTTVVFTNTGTVTLFGITLVDSYNTRYTCPPTANIVPDQTRTCTGAHLVTQADVDAGSVPFDTSATATSLTAGDVFAETSLTVEVAQMASATLDVTVTSTGPYVLGSTISHQFVVKNTGTVTLTYRGLARRAEAGPITGTILNGNCIATLDLLPGESFTCFRSNSVSQADIAQGFSSVAPDAPLATAQGSIVAQGPFIKTPVGAPVEAVTTVTPTTTISPLVFVAVLPPATLTTAAPVVSPEPTTAAPTIPTTVEPRVPSSTVPLALRLSAATADPGGELIVYGSGFAPNANVAIELHSDPISLGTARADANGMFTYRVTVPLGIVGVHHVVASGVGPEGTPVSVEALVTVATPAQVTTDLALTGSSPASLVTVASLLILAGVVLIRRRTSRLTK